MRGVRQVQVIAHRGASGYLPEHTLEAKAMAYAIGAEYLEQDVVLTKDDVPVVMHDIHLDTISDVAEKFPERKREDGRFYAIDFTVAEIKQLNASERFNAKTGKAVYAKRFPAHTGQFQIPTLAEELAMIQGLNQSTGKNVGIYPELKHPAFHHQEGKDLSRQVLKVLADFDYKDESANCFVQCFEAEENQRLRKELSCRLPLIQLLSKGEWMTNSELSEERTKELKEIASFANGIGPEMNCVLKADPRGGVPLATELTVDAHRHNLLVHPWTIRVDQLPKICSNIEDLHQALVLAGVDAVFSDFPDVSVELFRLFGKAS